MTQVNQAGDLVQEERLTSPDDFRPGEVEQALLTLLQHLNLTLHRTNATKYGNVELQICESED